MMLSENLHFLFTFYIVKNVPFVSEIDTLTFCSNVLFSFIFVVFKGLG